MTLCAGKSDEVDDICSDILKHATDRFIDYNYCRMDMYIISFLSANIIGTSELQFGYKTKSSTGMCSTSLTETWYLYTLKTPVYVLLIDTLKAFDSLSHIKLFNTSQAHGICPLIIQVLYNMYTNSDMQVRWKSELTNVFPLMNGIKQGGCLSLFVLYTEAKA